MRTELVDAWKRAIEGCGGLEKFEKDMLPLCSESVRACWLYVKKEVESSS
jgi:hypothetical protein